MYTHLIMWLGSIFYRIIEVFQAFLYDTIMQNKVTISRKVDFAVGRLQWQIPTFQYYEITKIIQRFI